MNVSELKSVGKARLLLLNKMGIFTAEDLIERLPRDYIDRTNLAPVADVIVGEENVIRAKVLAAPENLLKNAGITITKVRVGDRTGSIEAVWFKQPYLKNRFKVGEEYIFTGRVMYGGRALQMTSPDFEPPNAGSLSTGRIVPVYRTTEGLTQKIMRGLIKQALDLCVVQVEEFLPQDVLLRYNLCTRSFAMQNIHFPENDGAYFAARRRLVFEELFLLRFGLLRLKGAVKSQSGPVFAVTDIDECKQLLPFSLTNAQNRVMLELIDDITSGFAMNRLIQGDVGSGKTAVAMLACWLAAKNGYQSALMAPTETLAVQHAQSFNSTFNTQHSTLRAALLTGSVKAAEKKRIKAQLSAGEIDVIIGTHALIQDSVEFNNLGLVITDEQHRFGVRQRGKLANKGAPHVLVMTATPIPRTLALILYGDMDISVIDELPPGRQPIKTNAVNSSYRERVFAFIKKLVNEGRQAYIICPLVERSDMVDAVSVEEYADGLCKTAFSGYKTAVLHGRMKPDQKNAVMAAFAANETSILISTTVIEVGVNVPNATVMLIENAERFGLSQLHQLRGRVGRGREQSYCVMISDSKSEITKQRLSAMQSTNDGFVLSETDLKLRGPGEFFGTAQHGLPEMLLANLYKDIDVLKEAQEAAERLKMKEDENAALIARAEKKLGLGGRVEL